MLAPEVMPAAVAPTGAMRWAARAEAALGLAVETAAAALVAVETAVLLAGIIARYVFHSSLVWSDELASILFLWLAMLGAVVAFRRGEHMRMTALATRAPPALRAFLEALAVAAPILFLVLLLPEAIEFAEEEGFIVTPALEIPGSWRASALPVGLGLMLLVAVVRLLRVAGIGRALASLAVVGGIAAGFWWAGPALKPLGNLNLLIFFVGLVAATVLAGVPIAFCFGLATFGYLALTTRVPVMVVVGRMDEGMSHLILLAVPLFIFLGSLIEMTGMARAMIRFLANLLGHVRGGLSYVLVGAMYLVSGISGAKAADMAAVAPILFP